jgi:hypothetical protein
MQRDMSSHMDAALSTRNQGQLINQQTTVTRPVRMGNMREIPGKQAVPVRRAGGMNANATRSLIPGLSDVTVTGLGTTSWAWIGVSAIAGIVLWKLTAGKRRSTSERIGKALTGG